MNHQAHDDTRLEIIGEFQSDGQPWRTSARREFGVDRVYVFNPDDFEDAGALVSRLRSQLDDEREGCDCGCEG